MALIDISTTESEPRLTVVGPDQTLVSGISASELARLLQVNSPPPAHLQSADDVPAPLARAGGSSRSRSTNPGGLTDRELGIVALIGEGLSNADIASRSYLSINSVKSYIRSAYFKIDVTTRAQAIRWALARGLAELDVVADAPTDLAPDAIA